MSNIKKNYDENQYLNEKTYNNQLPEEGEVIAPFVVTWEQVTHDHMDQNNLKTWTLRGGRKVLVAFMVCKREEFAGMMKIYNFMADGHVDEEEEDHLSLDKMAEDAVDPDKKSQEPAIVPSAEETFLASVEIDELITEVKEMDAKSGAILELLRADTKKGDILKQLGLGKSQGYEDIKTAQKLARTVRNQYL